jgi:hypothetical protein
MPRTDVDEGSAGARRLLRAGLVIFVSASALWLLALAGATTLASNGSNPAAKVLILTFTVLLWPIAALGLLLLLCWLVVRIAAD